MPVSYSRLKKLRPKSDLNIRSHKEFENHEYVITLNDDAKGLKAYIAIHNRNLGPAHGGTRMLSYDREEDAIRDVLNLSKAMSYKSASLGLPYGGAKGVILWKDGLNKAEVLTAYAMKVDALNGLFRTGTDVGLSDVDVQYMSNFTKYMLGVHSDNSAGLTTSKTAALGVYYAMKATALYQYGSNSLKGKIIGIKGIGKLGTELVDLLTREEAHLLVADIDHEKTDYIKLRYPNEQVVPVKDIHKHRMNIYAPCALGDEFTSTNIKDLACEMIVGGANNQLADSHVGDEIFKKGILYAPDYIVNAGGLIFASEEIESDGFDLKRVMSRLNKIPKILTEIFNQSYRDGIATHRIANQIAEDRILQSQS
jgi:glutamate dehydrogenase/leucine dehydrogenase